MDFADMDDVGEFGETTDLNDVPNEHNYPVERRTLSNQSSSNTS